MITWPDLARALLVAGKILAVASVGCLAFTLLILVRNLHPPRYLPPVTPAAYGLPYETVEFQSPDGTVLSGWGIERDPQAPWVIFCHGLGAGKADLLDLAAGLAAKGFNVFLFDFRGHGASRGRLTSLGLREQRDLEGAIAYLDRRTGRHSAYGVLGISMGGAVALLVAASNQRVASVVADSSFADLGESMDHHATMLYHLPRVPFGWCLRASYWLLFQRLPTAVSPAAAVGRISPRPVFLINASADPQTPVADAHRLFEAAGEPKELWIVEDAAHLGSYAAAPRVYQERIAGFFRGSLGSSADSGGGRSPDRRPR